MNPLVPDGWDILGVVLVIAIILIITGTVIWTVIWMVRRARRKEHTSVCESEPRDEAVGQN